MKLKKHISKLLFCSILLNSMSFYSNADSNSNLNRYETLEGEFITLEDVTSDDITEIEIFGNTVQNPDNLEDIQSVGDLYVNEKGEPILDSQDREQYKIEITLVDGYNLINLDSNSWIERPENNVDCITKYRIPVKPNTIYTYRQNTTSWRGIDNVTKDGVKISNIFNAYGQDKVFTTPQNCYYINIYAGQTYGDFNQPLKREMLLYEGDKNLPFTKEQATQESKITILLPCKLMKIGNTADRLYWNNSKGKYIIEKKVEVYKPDNQSINSLSYFGAESSGFQAVYTSLPKLLRDKIGGSWHSTTNSFSNLFKATNQLDLVVGKRESIALGPDFLYIKYDVTKHTTTEEFKAFLIENGLSMLFITSKPEIIETNITEKIIFSIYPEKTYISTASENGIKSILKIAVDRIEKASGEAVENVLSNPTSSNIALARMFVNMLPESLYKDQLQAQLNEIFSEDMVIDRLTATANLDVYIKSENILMMSLDTNTVTFEDYSGVEELELQNAINISINSSLPYQLNAYVVGEIANKDKNKTLDLDVLNIKDSNELEYKQFDNINNKLVLLDNIEKGNNISHNIDLKLSGNKAHDADVYKTTIKFEVEQK